MRIILMALLSLAGVAGLQAQCDQQPPVIEFSPDQEQHVYCPDVQVTLSVSGQYDSYQWYYAFSAEGDTTALSGATDSAFVADAQEWGGSYFLVVVTQDTCTYTSERVLLDSWAFLPPAIAHSPQTEYCNGDSTEIRVAFAGLTNYQWLRDYEPIPGATDSVYWVKESGTYVLLASPIICPNVEMTSGVGPTFEFSGPEVPEITRGNDTLFASSGPEYQWLRNGQPIEGATDSFYVATQSGQYQVQVSDDGECTPISAPFELLLTGTHEPHQFALRLWPQPFGNVLFYENTEPAEVQLTVFTANGQQVETHKLPALTSGALPVNGYPSGTYLFQLRRQDRVQTLTFVRQ